MPSLKDESAVSVNGTDDHGVVSSISQEPVTVERKPFIQSSQKQTLPHIGTARANIAADIDHPNGTTKDNWAQKHTHQTVLRQHCEFFDRDLDGVIWPYDTYIGFYRLGYGVILSIISVLVIHINFAYPTSPSWIPDPFFRLFLDNVHKTRHGSDSGTFDNEGRFVPQAFEDVFAKYATEKDYLTFEDVKKLWSGQRVISDPIGWCGAIFEWGVTYILLWPEDGRMKKDDIRRVIDGSIFYELAERQERKVQRKRDKIQ